MTAAYLARFSQDDAFISLRYARNLAAGAGLVYNAGEHVEGYTNFLWTVLLAVPHLLGVDPVLFSQALGLTIFAGTLMLAGRLARLVGGSELDAVLVAGLLVLNYTFVSYATGGLETGLQAFLVLCATCLCLDERTATRPRRAIVLSVVLALALLTRLDSLVLLLPGLAEVVRSHWRRDSRALPWLGGLVLPATLLLGSWMIWKHAYYGEWLPNTARVKGPDPDLIGRGVKYVYHFLRSYWMAPVVLLVALSARALLASARTRSLVLATGLWLAYVVSVGGDFMEFRLLVPVLPLFFVTAVSVLPRERRLRLALLGTLVLGSFSHAVSFNGPAGIQPIWHLRSLVEKEGTGWRDVGLELRRTLAGVQPPPVLATTAAGAVPYYADLPTIDMHGLTDAWVARHGLPVRTTPGHRRAATTQYLLDRGVNLVVGHPTVEEASVPPCAATRKGSAATFELPDLKPEALPAPSRVLLLPMGRNRVLPVLYLVPHPGIDAVIARDHLDTCPL